MSRFKHTLPKIKRGARRASKTIPDQSLSIQEIVKRYVRGVPVDVVKREGVYLDQSDHDLEKLSRMDFAEKSEYANALRNQAESLKDEILDKEAQHREAQKEKARKRAQASKESEKNGGENPPA